MENSKILNLVERLTPPTDKLKHFYWGTLLTVFGTMLYLIFGIFAFIYAPALIMASLKELLDKKPSFMDWFWTSIIAIITTLLFAIFVLWK